MRLAAPASIMFLITAAIFLDLFCVALVVPQLIHRFRDLGITPASYGAVSSVYSASQILGGLLIGRLGDGALGRKRVLLLSFAGAGVSYFLVGAATSLELLILSRVVVGLTKQTMTCSTALVTQLSDDASRSQALGRLSSASTLAFLLGQPVGGFLASRYGRRLPCVLAAAIYALLIGLVQALLPEAVAAAPAASAPSDAARAAAPPPPLPIGSRAGRSAARRAPTTRRAASPPRLSSRSPAPTEERAAPAEDAAAAKAGASPSPASASAPAASRTAAVASPRARVAAAAARLGASLGSFRSACSGVGGRVLVVKLLYSFLMRATYSLHALYEQQRWQTTPETTGYLSSYKQVLGLLVDSLLVGPLAAVLPETSILVCALGGSAANALLEGSHSSFALYACANLPASAVAGALTRTTLSSLFSKAVPRRDAGSALSLQDVLNSAVGIFAPRLSLRHSAVR